MGMMSSSPSSCWHRRSHHLRCCAGAGGIAVTIVVQTQVQVGQSADIVTDVVQVQVQVGRRCPHAGAGKGGSLLSWLMASLW